MTKAGLLAASFGLALSAAVLPLGMPAQASSLTSPAQMAFREALIASLSEAGGTDSELFAFYAERDFQPIWMGEADQARRIALLSALQNASAHGLPAARYGLETLLQSLRQVYSEGERARLEGQLSQVFLRFGRDLNSGVLDPQKAAPGIVREVERQAPRALLAGITTQDPQAFMESLAPKGQSYLQLMRAKFALEQVIAREGWGATVNAKALKPGESGAQVIALRNRLQAMGYLDAAVANAHYDWMMEAAVRRFQADHGLAQDGVAASATLSALNTSPEARLQSVLVALERERWMNFERGARHIWVNLTDYSVQIVDDGAVSFSTRAVVGAANNDKPTPEFSHRMTYMELNPDWTVPSGIIKRDYLPKLKANRNALGHLQVVDRRGRVVPRDQIDFAKYSPGNFPFNLRQPPGRSNSLGQVKFMFPNPYAIYLHDTPEKHLFARDKRAYSSGCVRLNDPFDFAYALLARQESDPRAAFHTVLDSGKQERISLRDPVPVHLVYFTAFVGENGRLQHREDFYGRDSAIYEALKKAGL